MGCVYMIHNNENIYIGSTCDLDRRIREHKRSCKNENCKEYHFKLYKIIRECGGFDKFYIDIIEKYKLREDWQEAEKTFIRNLQPNMNDTTYKKNKDSNKIIKCECGKTYRKSNKSTHEKSPIHKKLMLLSIEERAEENRQKSKTEKRHKSHYEKFECECGRFYTKAHEKRHRDTPLHKRLMSVVLQKAYLELCNKRKLERENHENFLNTQITCFCGVTLLNRSLKSHCKSYFHKNFLANFNKKYVASI